jgi:UDP-N-acetylglucosamine 2-epimerase
MAAALVAHYSQIPFAHVEAGLRTGCLDEPFPEEANRRIADYLARMCFAPTAWAARNLAREGVAESQILVTRNTVVDVVESLLGSLPDSNRIAPDSATVRIMVTVHRRENAGQPLQEICGSIRDLAQSFEQPAIEFNVVLHPNPEMGPVIREAFSGVTGVTLLEPVAYLEFLRLLRDADLAMTDSGGVQEEAPSFGTPVAVLLNVTERPEGIEAGVAILAGTDRPRIVDVVGRLLADPSALAKMRATANPYGDGNAAPRIVDHLMRADWLEVSS